MIGCVVLRGFGFVARAVAGISPRRATYFLRRQKVGKKLSPEKPPLTGFPACHAACMRHGVRQASSSAQALLSVLPHCIEAQGRAQLTSLTAFAAFKQRGAKSEVDACFARALGFCASRRFLRGGPEYLTPTANSQTRNPSGGRIRYAPFSTAEQRKALRACAQRTSRTDSAQLFDRSAAQGVLRGPSRPEQRREPRSAAQGRCGRGELFAYFLAAQKVGRPPGRNPGTTLCTRQA